MWGFCITEKLVGNKAKGSTSKRVYQENKARKIFRKTNISYPLILTRTCAHQGGKKCSFFGKFGVLCFPETPILRFALLPYYRRAMDVSSSYLSHHKIGNQKSVQDPW